MAGEKKGEAFEALTYLALEPLGYTMHWGVKPKGFSIKPDMILGELHAPTHWLLLTSTSSAKNFEMKFWRNLGELFEVKRSYEVSPKVVNLVFEATQKQGLQDAMAAIADSDLCVENQPYGQILLNFIEAQISSLPSDREGKLIHFRTALLKDVEIQQAFQQFQADLAQVLTQEKIELEQLWDLFRSEDRVPGNCPIKTTYVRRGIAKLMICPRTVRQSIYAYVQEEQALPEDLPVYLYTLGLIQDAVGGVELSDKEVQNVIRILTSDVIEDVIEKSPQKAMQRWIEPVCNLENLRVFLDYIQRNYYELISPDGMLLHLQALYANPYVGLARQEISGDLHTLWLYHCLIDLFKAKLNRGQGFGYAALTALVRKNLSKINSWLDETGIQPVKLVGQSIIVRGLTDWVNRLDSSQARSFGKSFQGAVAWVLSNELAQIPYEDLPRFSDVSKFVISTNLEQKIIPYREFEPLPVLIETKLRDSNIVFRRIKNFPSFIGEYGNKSSLIATTPVIQVKNTLIHWKSSHKSHVHDKTKELAGRAKALRYQYRDNTFSRRDGIDRLVLIIDGEFQPKNIKTLLEVGWDEIYYPDEIDDLISSLRA